MFRSLFSCGDTSSPNLSLIGRREIIGREEKCITSLLSKEKQKSFKCAHKTYYLKCKENTLKHEINEWDASSYDRAVFE